LMRTLLLTALHPLFTPPRYFPPMSVKDLPQDARPREKLLTRGPAALSDAELLAILLRTGIPGKNVLQMADELLQIRPKKARAGNPDSTPLNCFGGIAGLLNASAEDLKPVKGLGPAKRCEIVAVLELARRAMHQQLQERTVLSDPNAVKHYLQLHLAQRSQEVFAVLFLDAQNKLLKMQEMFYGTLTQTSVYPREVVVAALQQQAAAVVLAHNHPSGSVQPSRADEALTQTLKAALALVDVRVLDHIIVGPGQALSMAQIGLV
jgi:DNA repair protein RadC